MSILTPFFMPIAEDWPFQHSTSTVLYPANQFYYGSCIARLILPFHFLQ